MTRVVSIKNDHQVYPNLGFSRLKNNGCPVLIELRGVQEEASDPVVPYVTLQDEIIRPIRKKPQMHSILPKLRGYYARGRAVNSRIRKNDYSLLLIRPVNHNYLSFHEDMYLTVSISALWDQLYFSDTDLLGFTPVDDFNKSTNTFNPGHIPSTHQTQPPEVPT